MITLEIFNVKLNVKDGDIMDWGMKDYKANGFPDKVTDMDGNVYLQTGYSNFECESGWSTLSIFYMIMLNQK